MSKNKVWVCSNCGATTTAQMKPGKCHSCNSKQIELSQDDD